LKIKNQITKNSGTKTQPDSAFQLSVTTIEEQGILESFARLPRAEREIVRQLLDEFESRRVAAIRFPVPFGPKSINERLRFLSPIYKLIRYHRLIFDSVADGAFRSTYLPWIDSIISLVSGLFTRAVIGHPFIGLPGKGPRFLSRLHQITTPRDALPVG
jgi:hypothetical protein